MNVKYLSKKWKDNYYNMKEIKNHLKENGISQKYLADQLGITQVTITNWFKGNSKPTKKMLDKVYQILSINQKPSHFEWDDNMEGK